MFLWDLAVGIVMEQFIDWLYGQVLDFLGQFLAMINMMGAELFDMDWIQGIVLFFRMLGWSLYAVGLVVSIFDTAIEMQNGRGSVRDTAINNIKAFMAVGLFTVVPIELYRTSITLQSSLTSSIAGLASSSFDIAAIALTVIVGLTIPNGSQIILMLATLLIGYAIIKVFFQVRPSGCIGIA